MPHVIVEYTNNIEEETHIPTLLQKINDTLLEYPEVIPKGGLRSRAMKLVHYCIADGQVEAAFVHVTLKLGKGRSDAVIQQVSERLFRVLEEYFHHLFETRYFALSIEVYEFTRTTYKKNNIHARYKDE